MNKFKLGIQLYTVRNELKEDFTGTLKFLTEQGVQGGGICFLLWRL